MTIALGFTCADALLICADTQITVSGVTKLHGSKIFREDGYPNGAKSAIAVAGDIVLARMAMQHIEQRIGELKRGKATLKGMRIQIEQEVREMHELHIYPNPDRYTLNLTFQLLISLWSAKENKAALFWTDRTTVNELRGYQAIGSGDTMAHYVVTEEGYIYTMPESRVRAIAVKAIAKAKDYVDGCGGYTELIALGKAGTLGQRERLPIPTTP